MNSIINARNVSRFVGAALFAALLSHLAHAQSMAPNWVNEAWRDGSYPSDGWYSGFAQNTLAPNADISAALKSLERDAQNKLIEGIVVRISGATTVENANLRTRQSGSAAQTASAQTLSSSNFRQGIFSSANAEVAKMETRSYYDANTGKIYAFAFVKKQDLASYYASRIEFYLQKADNDLFQAKQLAGSDKKNAALDKLAESKKGLDECGEYQILLSAINHDGGAASRGLQSREAKLRREIYETEAGLEESMVICIIGTETINGGAADIVIPSVQRILSQNNYRVTNSPDEANYHLRMEVKDCGVSQAGAFYLGNACVRGDLVNAKTGKSAGVIITKTRANAKEPDLAFEQAFERAAGEFWSELKRSTNVFK